MEHTKLRTLMFIVLFLYFPFFMKDSVVFAAFDNKKELECLKVPTATFLSSLKSTIEEVRNVATIVSKFANVFNDRRVTNAVNDCLDLLDYSVDELSLTISATENPHAKDKYSTGNRRSDLKTWLSAALGNQDTCQDGFDGSNSIVKTIIGGSLGQVTSLVTQVLGMVTQGPSNNFGDLPGKKHEGGNKFPSWMKVRDRGLLQVPVNGIMADVVVAKDGSGNYPTITEAVLAAPNNSTRRYVIYIKKGVYNEYVEIKKKKWNLMMVGDGMGVTVISAVAGKGFIARDLTFENTAGPEKHQAVALRCDSDLSAFYRCGIHGYQDTLYAHSLRQFYRECQISGTVDFIFGNGAAVLQNCEILARKPLPNQKNSITAQGRKDPNQNTGFSIQFCNITADADLAATLNSTYTYLGRPWKEYSKTIIMQSYISNAVRPEGWLEWNGNFALDTLYYAEYMNYGPGAGLSSRVKWPGYHLLNQSYQAYNFTVAQFIDGNLWLPSTGVRFTSGLSI
ncbi:hypothetical protein AQUCO_01300908v1 [Aquilegia coerulea]|uniref:Pectinesterase n=1 Tax=Aquilegia coerulea TaxID=218851 RepID=A0A2G5E421_AQUCA|nr:hypothetical protein AQUCO_01300908v1 [Aquilegia coerulea]